MHEVKDIGEVLNTYARTAKRNPAKNKAVNQAIQRYAVMCKHADAKDKKKGLGQFYRKEDNGDDDFSTDEDLNKSMDGEDDFEDSQKDISPKSSLSADSY